VTMVAVRSWTVVRRRGVRSAARCAARRYPAGWQAHGALPLLFVSNDTYSLLSVTESITPFGVADKRLLLWYKRQLLLSI